jgi:hypothetical protein
VVKPTALRQAVGFLQTEFEMSQRRAFKELGYCRASVQYQAVRDAAMKLVARLRALASERHRGGTAG